MEDGARPPESLRSHAQLNAVGTISDDVGLSAHESSPAASLRKTTVPGPDRISLPGSGSRMAVWSHHASATENVARVFVASKVLSGPKDEDIHVLGIDRKIEPNAENDFLPFDDSGRASDVGAFDAVHTFAIVRQVLTMYRRAVTRLDGAREAREVVDWYWNKTDDGRAIDSREREPLAVYPRFGPGTGGFYSRRRKQLEFEYFDPALSAPDFPESRSPRTEVEDRIFVCRSFDVVAHETGHAVLDGLRKGKEDPLNLEAHALHEAFADLTAVFAALSQLGQCENLILESKGDLLQYNPINVIGRRLGRVLYGRKRGLRSLIDRVPVGEAREDPYRLAQCFAGALYRCVARMFVLYQRRDWLDPAETLLRVARHLMELVLSAFRHAETLSFEDVFKTLLTRHELQLKAPHDITFLGDRVASHGILEEELDGLESGPVTRTVVAGERVRMGCFGVGP